MALLYATIPQTNGTPFVLYREPTYLSHVIKPGPIPYYETHEIEKPSPIPLSQEVRILKRSNPKTSRKWKPKKEYKIRDLVLVDRDPMDVKIHGKVGEDYYYIAKLNDELWLEPSN